MCSLSTTGSSYNRGVVEHGTKTVGDLCEWSRGAARESKTLAQMVCLQCCGSCVKSVLRELTMQEELATQKEFAMQEETTNVWQLRRRGCKIEPLSHEGGWLRNSRA